MDDVWSDAPGDIDPFGECPRFQGNLNVWDYGYRTLSAGAHWRRPGVYPGKVVDEIDMEVGFP
jgi:hypothetical protein